MLKNKEIKEKKRKKKTRIARSLYKPNQRVIFFQRECFTVISDNCSTFLETERVGMRERRRINEKTKAIASSVVLS